MNKRQAKKRLRYAIGKGQESLRKGIGVSIICQAYIDEKGRMCSCEQPGSRQILFKRPQIRYFSSDSESNRVLLEMKNVN